MTTEKEIIEEIKKLRADRKIELIEGNLEVTDKMIEKFLDEERHDDEYCWGNPRTDLLEAELKGIQSERARIKEEIKKRYMQFDNKCLRCLGNEIVWKELLKVIGKK